MTSWRVDVPLTDGRYYWRARAHRGEAEGPFSPISDFFVGSASATPPTTAGSELFDALTNGFSVGTRNGGRFTSAGWQVTHRGDFIRYVVPTISSGFVEWENQGLARSNPVRDQFSLFGMWDPSRGDYRENAFRVHIRKLDTNGHNPPYVRLRWIANGEQHDRGYDFLDWNPSRTYQWRIEWGPTGGSNEVRVYLDGRVIIRQDYRRSYSPSIHYIELGVEERAESIVGVVYRNVSIGRR